MPRKTGQSFARWARRGAGGPGIPRVGRSFRTSRQGWMGIVGFGSAGAFALPIRGSAEASASTPDFRFTPRETRCVPSGSVAFRTPETAGIGQQKRRPSPGENGDSPPLADNPPTKWCSDSSQSVFGPPSTSWNSTPSPKRAIAKTKGLWSRGRIPPVDRGTF